MANTFEILALAFEEQGTTALLVGGQALQAYGVHRQTMDVDCLMVDEDCARLEPALRQAGYQVQASSVNFRRYRHDSAELMDVDVVLVNRETMNGLLEESGTFTLGTLEFRIPGLLHLVAMKLHATRNDPRREPGDLADIAALIRANRQDLTADGLREICERYGPAELVERVVGFLA